VAVGTCGRVEDAEGIGGEAERYHFPMVDVECRPFSTGVRGAGVAGVGAVAVGLGMAVLCRSVCLPLTDRD